MIIEYESPFHVTHPKEVADKMMKDFDSVHHPKHYTSHASGVECIEIAKFLNFNLGNAFKYVWRAGLKDDFAQELQKAIWYIDNEMTISIAESQRIDRAYIFKNLADVIEFENGAKAEALESIAKANTWGSSEMRKKALEKAKQAINEMIDAVKYVG